jgi:XTP/dITP diphosphohydrolase
MEVVLASANPDKAAEIRAILAAAVPDLIAHPRPEAVPEVVEDAPDLVGNARLKAVALCEATGLAAVADDTGLEVDALGGAPGVFSARFAGEGATYADNVAKLLASLAGVDAPARTARFRTVALCRFPDGREVVAEGVCAGTVPAEAAGSGGFAYDPVFVPDEGDGRTFAEMSAEEKHAVSHRGRAFRALAEALGALGHQGG